MIEKVIQLIEEKQMISKGDKIIIAVSGGPDSICLLHILWQLKKKYSIELYVAHVNHCLRGEDADKDEDFVRQFCKDYNIDFYSARIQVDEIAKEKKISFETAAREVRYTFFKEVMERVNGNKIALAHNANDQCETVLMRIMRGTGIEGLAGIKPLRDNIYIRPLIKITREEIEDYCRSNVLETRLDKSNLETIYTRNKIRLELIPYIKENFNSNIVQSINRLVENIEWDIEFMDFISKEIYNKYAQEEQDRVILLKELFLEPRAIISRVIRNAINSLQGNLLNFEKVHIDNIIKLHKLGTGKIIELPKELIALNNYEDIHILKRDKDYKNDTREQYELHLGRNDIKENMTVNLEMLTSKDILIKEEQYIKFFDYDKITKNIVLRYRKDGDRIKPLGMKGSKKLKDLFIDLKIPKEKRNDIPLICFGEEIAWVIGYRISEDFKIEKSTKNILKISIEREAEE
ncbi:tRNA lysidine(34) synthetase TilS [Clostridium malenominatum]|uniref:tRNA(Ile)-lysidine synthase n=1 Tax=Clostridium malenominatum TaxID=1539 RepID=A0ABN1J1M5_9CLOT